jgi:hypothetical protein
MSRISALAATSLLTAALLSAADASATKYSLWIHGRDPSQSTQPGNYANFSYWGSAATAAGVNKKAVNWDGVSHISDSNFRIRNALDCFCTGANSCYIAAHSAGDAQIGYALSLFGTSTRSVKNAIPDASGVCGNAGGTQAGWNIIWVDVGGGAAGGTELANIGAFAVSDPLTSDLKTATVRSLYNHNNTAGKSFHMFAGAKGAIQSILLPGEDDSVIAYHSSGGLSATGSFCNPGGLFCDDTLFLGTEGSKVGSTLVAKWSNHTVLFRDDSESFDHFTNNAWAGIISQVRADMVTHAF